MPVKKSVRSKPSTSREAAAKPAKGKGPAKSSGPESPFGVGAILLAIVCVIGLAMVMAARESGPADDVAKVSPVVKSPAQVPKSATTTKPPRPAATPSPANAVAAKPADAPPAPAPGAVSGGMTVTGCLERSDDGFRLKDTSGDDAPKSRSWKSGFLKKGSAPISIVHGAGGVNLLAHIGQRVTVTGALIDREMRVQSLRTVSATCKQ